MFLQTLEQLWPVISGVSVACGFGLRWLRSNRTARQVREDKAREAVDTAQVALQAKVDAQVEATIKDLTAERDYFRKQAEAERAQNAHLMTVLSRRLAGHDTDTVKDDS